MVVRLNTADLGFEEGFRALLDARRDDAVTVDETVRNILADVRIRGDEALVEYTSRFDRMTLAPDALRMSEAEIAGAAGRVEPRIAEALRLAHDRIAAHHARQKPEDHVYTDALGVRLGTRWTPIQSVGIYVPGGLASYPSSVLMNAVPARVAGVDRIAMVVPTPDGVVNPAVFCAARLAGVTEIYRVGGAQAVAALAYGTSHIPAVDKIVGPGNAFVAEAKRQVFGVVGIDMIAGPSEVLVIADETANPAWVAADLLAQAEHGAGAQPVAIATSQELADAVVDEVERQLGVLRRGDIARAGWDDFGAVIAASSLDEAAGLSNRFAPEHLELAVSDPDALLASIRHAGAIFLGHHTPEAVGDYVGGSNHVLPTSRAARFSSGLGTIDFMKRSSLLGLTPEALGELAAATVTLAEAEDLEAHGRSVSIRQNR